MEFGKSTRAFPEPSKLLVTYQKSTAPILFTTESVELKGKDRTNNWIELEVNGVTRDVVLICWSNDYPAPLAPIHFPLPKSDLRLRVTDRIVVIGFPAGIEAKYGYPIWKGGLIASEPDHEYYDLPCMLIDSRTYSGMSGSPVYILTYGEYTDTLGNFVIGSDKTLFIGVYSARIPGKLQDNAQKSDIGLIWKEEVIERLLVQAEK